MIGFARRNLKVFFRDKTSVFFSLLAVLIIIGLYVLFLGDILETSMQDTPGARYLMDTWIMAGMLAVTSLTTTMGAFGILVEDRVKKINKDFIASPMPASHRAGGYVLSSFAVGVIMSVAAAVLAQLYIAFASGHWLAPLTLLKMFGLMLLSSFACTSMVLFLVSFFKSTNAFATASTIIGTMVGFLAGIYIPIGQLPDAVQWVIKCFPVSHAAALFRQVMMADAMSASFAGAPESAVTDFEQLMGVTFRFGDAVVSPLASVLILLGTAAVFFVLSMFSLSRKRA